MSFRTAAWLILPFLSGPVLGANLGTVAFEGNRFFDSPRLCLLLEDQLGDLPWSLEETSKAARAIQTFYQDKGFPLAKVKKRVNDGQIHLVVSEGPRARVRQVLFRGNSAFPEVRLETFFRQGRWYCRSELEDSMDQLRSLYLDHGYLFFHASEPEFRVLEKEVRDSFPLPFLVRTENSLVVKISIEEGEQYRVGRVSMPMQLREAGLTPPERGKLLSRSEWGEFRYRIEDFYKEQDQLLKRFELLEHLVPETHEIDVTIIAEPNPPLLVGRIELVGHESFPDSFYRREIELIEGDIFSPRKLTESLRKLSRTGVLDSLSLEDVELKVDPVLQEIDLRIDLKERERKRIAYSIDPNTLFGWESSVLFTVLNALGLGENLGLDLRYGDQTTGVALALASRYLVGTDLPISLLFGFFRRHNGFDVPGVDEEIRGLLGTDRQGFTTALSYRITEENQTGLTSTTEQITSGSESSKHLVIEPFYLQGQPKAKEFLKAATRFSFHSGPELSWNWQPEFTLLRNFEVPENRSKLSLRTQVSHVLFYGPNPSVSDRIFLSSSLLRGFSSFPTGPWAFDEGRPFPAGGDTVGSASLEYRLPRESRLEIVPFIDCAWLASLNSLRQYELIEETNGIFRSSFGTEFRVPLPSRLPTPGVTVSWNPFRLDEMIPSSDGVTRLRDPRFRIRFTLDR